VILAFYYFYEALLFLLGSVEKLLRRKRAIADSHEKLYVCLRELFQGETGKFLGFALVVWRKWRNFAEKK